MPSQISEKTTIMFSLAAVLCILLLSISTTRKCGAHKAHVV